MKLKTLLYPSSFSLKLKEKWVAFMRPDEVLNNNNISKPHRLKSYGFHLPLLGHQGEAVLVLAGFLPTLLISLFSITPTSAIPYISLSFNNLDVSINIPANGGIGVSNHTLNVKTNAINGYDVTMLATSDNMVDPSGNKSSITAYGGGPTGPGTLPNNQWGIAIAGNAAFSNDEIYQSTEQSVLLNEAKWSAPWYVSHSGGTTGGHRPRSILSASGPTNPNGPAGTIDQDNGINQTIYYGARVDDTKSIQSGDHTAKVTYTATAKLPIDPTITKVSPDTYELCDHCANKITITGKDLGTVTAIYIDTNSNGIPDQDELCDDLTRPTTGSGSNTTASSTELSCYVPILSTNSSTNPSIPHETATYNLIIEADSESGVFIAPTNDTY